jgi:hypothetical protein
MSHHRTISLDLEGTIISTAVSQIPRPHLAEFGSFCMDFADGVEIRTGVNQEVAEEIMRLLVSEGSLPPRFRYEIVDWDRRTDRKDLTNTGMPLERIVHIDDVPAFALPSQKHRWIIVPEFTGIEDYDRELVEVVERVESMF